MLADQSSVKVLLKKEATLIKKLWIFLSFGLKRIQYGPGSIFNQSGKRLDRLRMLNDTLSKMAKNQFVEIIFIIT